MSQQMTVFAEDAVTYTLNSATSIGKGFSGEVYRIDASQAAKIYTGGQLTPELLEKIRILIGLSSDLKNDGRTASVVLPSKVLHKDYPKGEAVGFLMPFVADARPIHQFGWKRSVEDEDVFDQIVADLLFDLCEAISALHERRIYVCDLKPDNLLVAKGVAHIVDFDSCSIMPEYYGENFTEGYLDPRLREDDPEAMGPFEFDELSDWWALAVIGFELFSGISPWHGVDPKIAQGEFLEAQRAFHYSAVYLNGDIKYPFSRVRSPQWLQKYPALMRYFRNIFSEDPTARRPISEALLETGCFKPTVRGTRRVLSEDPLIAAGYEAVRLSRINAQQKAITRAREAALRRTMLRGQFVTDLLAVRRPSQRSII